MKKLKLSTNAFQGNALNREQLKKIMDGVSKLDTIAAEDGGCCFTIHEADGSQDKTCGRSKRDAQREATLAADFSTGTRGFWCRTSMLGLYRISISVAIMISLHLICAQVLIGQESYRLHLVSNSDKTIYLYYINKFDDIEDLNIYPRDSLLRNLPSLNLVLTSGNIRKTYYPFFLNKEVIMQVSEEGDNYYTFRCNDKERESYAHALSYLSRFMSDFIGVKSRVKIPSTTSLEAFLLQEKNIEREHQKRMEVLEKYSLSVENKQTIKDILHVVYSLQKLILANKSTLEAFPQKFNLEIESLYLQGLDEKLLYLQEYKLLLVYLNHFFVKREIGKKTLNPKLFQNTALRYFKGQQLNYLLFYFSKQNPLDTTILKAFYTNCTDTSYQNYIKNQLAFSQLQQKSNAQSILYTVNEEKVNFESILQKNKGNIILIDFWATWCQPCIKEVPTALSYASKFSNRNFTYIMISTDKSISVWKNYIAQYKLSNVQHYLLVDAKLKDQLGIKTIPRYLLINSKGEIVHKDFYRPSDRRFETEIEKLLK